METLDAMGTTRSMRWLLPDPISDDVVDRLLWAATRASSAHNSQPWHFLVVRDPGKRAAVGAAIRAAVSIRDPLPPDPHSRSDRLIDAGVRNLFENIDDAPVHIYVCAENNYPPEAPSEHMMWAAIHSAAQNLLVAARSLGVGAAHTKLHMLAEPVMREVLGIPADITLGMTMPIGWPARKFGELSRRPLSEVVHRDVW